jgi:hypothetical protein
MSNAWVPHPLVCKGAGLPITRNVLHRFDGRGDLHFIAFSCYRRQARLVRYAAQAVRTSR